MKTFPSNSELHSDDFICERCILMTLLTLEMSLLFMTLTTPLENAKIVNLVTLERFSTGKDNEDKRIALQVTDLCEHARILSSIIKYGKESALFYLDIARRCGVVD
ncbi:hypothetical protein KIN20_019528 [Parelaphostrongylus tenuis]|uniref:Uncharacterized protein n=1 Tax=Parelaphostrongylus tenuis TaxID=148309 RepID=A0AAD5QSZ4_PARTN|nr:hypothetical protein KIN20_019528 [Parelaphostrongylus tenuis]